MSDPAVCILCGSGFAQVQRSQAFLFYIDCQECGRYLIGVRVAAVLQTSGWEDLRRRLSWKVWHENDSGRTLEVTIDNFESLADLESWSVSRKMSRLLEEAGRITKSPGDPVTLGSPHLVTLLRCHSRDEPEFLISSLVARGLLEQEHYRDPNAPPRYCVTAKGWDALEPTVGSFVTGTCFVAMSFDPSLRDAYENGIKAAVEIDCGLEARRVDQVEHNDPITDQILAGIRAAQLTVADVTLHRQGVYFEAGFARGLGRIVIWTCRADEIGKAHFDTRQYPHILWSTPAELRQKLALRVQATVALPARLK